MISTQQRQSPQQIQEDEDEEQTNSSGFCAFCLELVGGTSKKQNWKALGIAFLVITIICLFITLAIFLTRTQQIPIENRPQPIEETDISQIQLPSPWNGTWISEYSFIYLNKNNSIWIYHCDTLESEILFDREDFIDHAIVSPSTKFILVPIEKEKIRSYYTEYRYHIYERRSFNQSIILRNEPKFPFTALAYSHSDHLFAFVYNFNVYLFDLKENIDSQITFDGNGELIHNGLIEWIYEYEIFQKTNLLFWSVDDRYLAYLKINLTNLSKNTFLKYDFNEENDDRYTIPYPKFNQSIPQISAHIYDTKTRKILRIPRPFEYEKSRKSYVYIYHFVWYSPRSFAVVYGNRRENSSIIQLYEILNERILVKSRYIEETRRGLIISRYLKPVFSPLGNSMYIIRFEQLNIVKSKQKAFPRVVRIPLNEGLMQIDAKSSNEILAEEIIHIDRVGSIYFTGSRRNDSLERQLFRWDLSNTECLSCNQSCAYASAKFSLGDGKYYILQCFGPNIPYAKLFNQTNELALINDNQPFQEWIDHRLMPYIDYFTVPLTNKNTGNGMIIFPPNYTPNRTIASYPVIITINDRLGDQRVTKKYFFSLPEFLQVIEGNIALVIFDAHGSAGQDENFYKNNYQDWFERQVEDYLKLARYLKWNETRFSPTLNHTQFGLRARGPAAMIALKLLEDSEEFNCAFLRSPVTDLNHYHAIFSERVYGFKSDLKFPKDRKETLKNKSLTIVHGTADEVVHFKHSARLVQSLISGNIPFDFKVYPDIGHHFDENPKIYQNFLHSERQFFHHCLGSRINKERKLILSEEDYD